MPRKVGESLVTLPINPRQDPGSSELFSRGASALSLGDILSPSTLRGYRCADVNSMARKTRSG